MGEDIGSSRIDRYFERLARDKLRKVAHENNLTEEWNTAKMSRQMRETPDFQNNKKNLDMKKVRNEEYFTVPIPHTNSTGVLVGDGVTTNQLKFDWYDNFTLMAEY